MLSTYWPRIEHIESCIKLEAEELEPQVLLSVHEPMTIRRKNDQLQESEVISKNAEEAVLANIMDTNRPVPIIGDSGSGKSHLIKWLDIKLRNNPETKNWIVRRIPKSTSLRGVLSILLEDLEGEEFDKARSNIEKVGGQLSISEVAEHLIVNINTELAKLYDRAKELKEHLRELPRDQVSPEDVKRINTTISHAVKESLPSLLGDSFYKRILLEPETGCIYQIAKRLIDGGSTQDLEDDNYYLSESDLDFNALGDEFNELSKHAREYVSNKGLNSNRDAREKAVELVNSVISDACGSIYQQFFQLHGGSFLDLFTDIRKSLKGKTLVILIEDMSLITAIESDLVTSLTREEVRDGVQELCELKSALAVTTGYSGYLKHRNSLVGRNGGNEWELVKEAENSTSLFLRVEDFCGRYLNAARHGSIKLKELSLDNPNFIYSTSDADEIKIIEEFGLSPAGFPLFPFNKQAIMAYSERICRDNISGALSFNPRSLIRHLLLENLKVYRDKYIKGVYPPANLSGISCPSSLEKSIRSSVHHDQFRAVSLAAIWGFGAKNMAELASCITSNMARVFNIDDLAHELDSITPVKLKPGSYTQKTSSRTKSHPSSKPKDAPVETPNIPESTSDKVDDWFANKVFPQEEARLLRNFLFDCIVNRSADNFKWQGVKLPVEELVELLKPGATKAPYIKIPFREADTRDYLSLITYDDVLSKSNELDVKLFITAVLRKSTLDTNYDESMSDYCIIENYLSSWLPYVFEQIIAKARKGFKDKKGLKDALKKQCQIAISLHPPFANYTNKEKVDFLCSKVGSIDGGKFIANLTLSKSGLSEWDDFVTEQIRKWEDTQKAWLKYVSINNHAINGIVVQEAMRGLNVELDVNTSSLIEKSCQQVKLEFSLFRSLVGLTNKQSFDNSIEELSKVLVKMTKEGQYRNMENELTAKKVQNRVKKIIEENHWESVKGVISLLEPFNINTSIGSLQKIQMHKLKDTFDVVNTFYMAKRHNLDRIKSENEASGSNAKEASKAELSSRIIAIQSCCHELTGQGEKI